MKFALLFASVFVFSEELTFKLEYRHKHMMSHKPVKSLKTLQRIYVSTDNNRFNQDNLK